MSRSKIFEELSELTTEARNPRSQNIDTRSTREILSIINEEDKTVASAVEKVLDDVARAIDIVVESQKVGGRLLYIGAGTSGRLGILDAAECPPTFGTRPERVQGIIAGGEKAVFRSQEGAEDKPEGGAGAIAEKEVGPHDVVCGIAASGRTPFVLGALEEARRRGAKTIFVVCNNRGKGSAVDVLIAPIVGAEVIMGSTRMKAGTATKMILNMITTAAMIRLGKVYENVMVDLQLTNEKLHERAKRIIMMMTECSYEEASHALEEAGGSVKNAIIVRKKSCSGAEASKILEGADGRLREALR